MFVQRFRGTSTPWYSLVVVAWGVTRSVATCNEAMTPMERSLGWFSSAFFRWGGSPCLGDRVVPGNFLAA
jgi:hypothetical protein